MASVHEDLASMLRAGKFEPYIRYIRFPYFRNIRQSTRIVFGHPITALVGPNGTNKTAILRALQGCPDYYNVGQYWFSTSLDPIDPESRHRFIYGYLAQSTGRIVEVMKTRIERPGNPDYFEPTRPILRDGMEKMPPIKPGEKRPLERTDTRWKAVDKKVLYLDFRSELSAFDKCFFHAPQRGSTSSLAGRKAFIRNRSTHLLQAIQGHETEHTWYKVERIVKPVFETTEFELERICEILGRDYTNARVIGHRYFNVEGKSVILNSPYLQYSEAFAGSGEFAVTMLVTAVTRAEPASLILLDEPEVSLHPGAQRKLMDFLAQQAKLKRHQIVVSTHSPEIIRDLPTKAIKVFHPSKDDGKVELISQESDPAEAFFRLGSNIPQLLTIYVEDKLAALLVKAAIRPLGEAANRRIQIEPIPGGAASIQQKFIPGFALAHNTKSLVLLDGDQRPNLRPDPLSVTDLNLEGSVKEYAHGEVQLSLDGNRGNTKPSDKTGQLRQVLQWFHDHVDYLPGTNPDALLLHLVVKDLTIDGDAKITWADRAHENLGREDWERESLTSQEILAEQERALALVSTDAPELAEIRERIKRFLQQHPM